MMIHLDIGTNDLDAGVARAIELGAYRQLSSSPSHTSRSCSIRTVIRSVCSPVALRGEFDTADWHGTTGG